MKKILLISNMYPSNKNKHYGIFVKNVEALLKSNGYNVDKVIMYKTNNKQKGVVFVDKSSLKRYCEYNNKMDYKKFKTLTLLYDYEKYN